MAWLKRVLRIAAAAAGAVLYLWFAGVRNAGRAKRNRALRRRARAGSR
jgi:hypothetical protein